MRTDVHIVARPGRSPRIRASGGLAVRQTGPDALHLISTAATPLGGDHVEITVEVEEGARLRLSTVAATIALPSRTERRSTMNWIVLVGPGADLAITPLPTIVAADADLISSTTVRADPTSTLWIDERVQLGRHDEDGGRWTGRLHVDLAEDPALRHRLVLDSADTLGSVDQRALLSAFRYPDTDAAAVSAHTVAARLQLACGGSLTTVVGRSLSQVERDLIDLS